MTRGRKRKFNPEIPGHIDQGSLPRGIYWGDGRWYVLDPHPEGAGQRKETVAGRKARQSDLHAIMESRVEGDASGTLVHLTKVFKRSSEYKALGIKSRHGYTVRLRGIEVDTLTDAEILPEGILSNRRKGSRDNITRWTKDLRQAVDWLQAYRSERMAAHGRPVPIKAGERRLLVSESGTPLTKSALDTAWQRMIKRAITESVITDAQRFALHGLKHRGITDSDDKSAGGHRTEAMRQRYDHEVPVVKPPTRR